MDSTVQALAVSGTDVYAGGNFTNAGGISAKYTAKWDGIVGRRWGRGWAAFPILVALFWRWRCRAATCMQEAFSRRQEASRPTLPHGTGAVGRRWVRASAAAQGGFGNVLALAAPGTDGYAAG